MPAIERAAAQRFRNSPHPFVADLPVSTVGDYQAYYRAHLALVAVDGADRPIGFAVAREVDGLCFLAELDVLPAHQGRGVGRALIAAVEGWARRQGLPAVSLTTFRRVPWNAPFYARLGYQELGEPEIGPELDAIRRRQAAAGLSLADRCCMVKPLSAELAGR